MWKSLIVLTLIAVLLLSLCGCSMVGLAVGSVIDHGNKKQIPIEGWQADSIPEGANISATLNDGSAVTGKLCGIDFAGSSSFQQTYAGIVATDSLAGSFPHLGDSLTLMGRGGSLVSGKFTGIDRRRKEIQWEYWLKIEQEDRDEPRLCRLADIRYIQWSDTTRLDGTEFGVTLTRLAKTPVSSISVCGGDSGARLIPVCDISYLTYTKKGHAATTGFLIGAAVDVAIVIAAAASASREDPPPPRDPADSISCPFIYSFDGESYHLDAEPLGTSFCRAFERSDWVNLHHLRQTEGEYRIRIANELPETEFVDEVKLLVIDHPTTAQVIFSATGEPHTITTPQTPSRATDFAGNNQLGLVRATDGRVWISNPFGRDPENPDQVRDGLELGFTKPENAETVKLTLTVKNTPWGAEMLHDVLVSLGSDARNWYDLIASSTVARAALKEALIREGMLLIKIRDGRQWQTVDFVWGVGPKLFKERVFEIDISEFVGDVLNLRLESTAGFWEIDGVAVDYSPDLPVSVTELTPVRAVNYQANDVTKILTFRDNSRCVLAANTDRVELTFAAPELPKNLARSLVVKCTGYYETLIPLGTPSHVEDVTRYIGEPTAFAKYAIAKLNQNLAVVFTSQQIGLIRMTNTGRGGGE